MRILAFDAMNQRIILLEHPLPLFLQEFTKFYENCFRNLQELGTERFKELKCLYSLGDQLQNLILYNNQDILIEGKSIYYGEWLKKGIVSIRDLLVETGCF